LTGFWARGNPFVLLKIFFDIRELDMSDIVREITLKRAAKNKHIGEFKAGDTVNVFVRIREGDKDRVQLYKGVCMRIQGKGVGRSFTVRKISAGVGVERTFPFASPAVDKVEVVAHGKVRRARLYFLRGLKGKAARLESDLVQAEEVIETDEEKAIRIAAKAEAKAAHEKAPKVKKAKPAKK
jgi:large subunit ribosomal protein L19